VLYGLLRPLTFSLCTKPVKVALVDDGVDARHLHLRDNTKGGVTYCTSYRGEKNITSSYYASSSGHGIWMATLIYCEGGSGRGGQHQQQQLVLGGGRGLLCTVKSRPSPTSILMTKREEKEEKDACCLPELGCLATYVGCAHVCLC
jgi:hypothetical protein